jgi:hypothetical protein
VTGPIIDIPGVTGEGSGHVTQLGFALIAIFLLILIASATPKFGGALVIVVVIGMVYAAHNRNPPLI